MWFIILGYTAIEGEEVDDCANNGDDDADGFVVAIVVLLIFYLCLIVVQFINYPTFLDYYARSSI
jgi:hypothetical protein